jgi:hypothetical protein
VNPDDVPTEITRLAYTAPGPNLSQNVTAAMLAHYWPAIEKHVREQVAREIEDHPGPIGGEWMDSRDRAAAARIARTGTKEST